MQAYARAKRSTDTTWEAYQAKFDEDKRVLRAKGAQIDQRLAELHAQQAALAEQHGGTKVKGTDKLKLNVGGQRVVARRETLCQFPTTRLAALFSGRWENRLLRDKKGRVFLDVNPACFKKIVDFHNLYKIADPDDPPSLPEVAPEDKATFDRLCDFFGLTEALAPPVPELDSAIVSEAAHLDALNGWLEEAGHGGAAPQLLYRASRDGWAASQFHALCDGKGPTLTVIKCTGGFIFGGYADVAWNSSGSYMPSTASFLFALHCHSGLGPTKMPLTGANNGNAMYGNGGYGPTFGAGHDIRVADNANANTSSQIYLGNSYRCPPGQTGTFLTGSKQYQAAEVEVFLVQ
jgi:hypothetical protein